MVNIDLRLLAVVLSALLVLGVTAGASGQEPMPSLIRKSGAVLLGSAIERPAPEYPPSAKAKRVHGAVTVELMIDEQGAVTSAQTLSGHELLRASAETAARKWKFQPARLSGHPMKVTGSITFNYELPNSFSTFLGLKYEDTLADAERKFGKPARVRETPSFIQVYYFNEGLRIDCQRDTLRLRHISVAKHAVDALKTAGVQDDQLLFLGLHRNDVLETMGKPDGTNDFSLTFDYFRSGQRTRVMFAWNRGDPHCRLLGVSWTYSP